MLNKQELFDLIKPACGDNTTLYGVCGLINIEFGKYTKEIKAKDKELREVCKEAEKREKELVDRVEWLEIDNKELKAKIKNKGKSTSSDDALQQILDLFMQRVSEGTASASDFNALKEIFGWTNKTTDMTIELVTWEDAK